MSINERIHSFKGDIIQGRLSYEEILQKHLIESNTYFFHEYLKDSSAEFSIKSAIASSFSVHLKEVLFVGSAKLGFSLNPKNLFNEFDESFLTTKLNSDKSDIDTAIISTKLYDEIGERMYKYTAAYATKWEENEYYALEKAKQFPVPLCFKYYEYITKGWFRPDYRPLGFEFCRNGSYQELDPAPGFQRKLVWRKQHKFDFIETILVNYPFPEIYIAPGKINTSKISFNEFVVDGQQRLTTIQNYINGYDVFALDKIPIKKFSELSVAEKEEFLAYDVSVRYLKNATKEQITDIFQRINRTEYALNKTERLNAQWGDSEFICFSKQLIEEELDINMDLISYKVSTSNRKYYLNFFHKKYNIFTGNDINRMLSLQYMLTLIATLHSGEYFNRNGKIQVYIENQFEEFPDASKINNALLSTLKFIDKIKLDRTSYWFNKANIFSLIAELYKYEVAAINVKIFKAKLEKLEEDNSEYLLALKEKRNSGISKENLKYIEFSREGVNSKNAREYRGKIINKYIKASLR